MRTGYHSAIPHPTQSHPFGSARVGLDYLLKFITLGDQLLAGVDDQPSKTNCPSVACARWLAVKISSSTATTVFTIVEVNTCYQSQQWFEIR